MKGKIIKKDQMDNLELKIIIEVKISVKEFNNRFDSFTLPIIKLSSSPPFPLYR